jgi:hypothetical protein
VIKIVKEEETPKGFADIILELARIKSVKKALQRNISSKTDLFSNTSGSPRQPHLSLQRSFNLNM